MSAAAISESVGPEKSSAAVWKRRRRNLNVGGQTSRFLWRLAKKEREEKT
jgi:hypothetical protein